MLSKKKQKALFVVVVTGLILIAAVVVTGFLAYLAFPLILALVCILLGMVFKWAIEWGWKNAHKLRVGEKAKIVKDKLNIDRGVDLVKESIDTLRNKKNGDTEVSKTPSVGKVENTEG